MDFRKTINRQRQRRRFHVRNKIRNVSNVPRLCVHRTLKNISCQVIDDSQGKTLASASTSEKALSGNFSYGGNCEAAAKLGAIIAERAIAAGVTDVAFDRGHAKYQGRIAALADAAREGGLKF